MSSTRAPAFVLSTILFILGLRCAASGVPSGSSGGGAGDAGTETCKDAIDCDAFDGPCLEGACLNGTCESLPANDLGVCDDGLFCTVIDTCHNGECIGGSSRFCPSSDDCHIGACDEASGTCVSVAGNEGALCEDGDLCTLAGTCSSGVCSGAPPVDCTALDGPCTVGVCNSVLGCAAMPANEDGACGDAVSSDCAAGVCHDGQCEIVAANESATCDDGLYCTVGELCQNGQCAGGTLKLCTAPSTCWMSACDEALDACVAMPGNDGAACDDGSPCTTGTSCANGACVGGAPADDGVGCDDGLACTMGEVCAQGVCAPTSDPLVYFRDDFASNGAGWTLGPEWEIGPAQASMNGAFGADPAMDHTSGSDNGVAGVVIGGNASTSVHSFHWIESPAFDTLAATGAVVLGFYRWLNSDFTPFMDNAVEVWDGTTWIRLWTSGPPPRVQDSPPIGDGWTYVQYDVTAYKNGGMRVRFGMNVGGTALQVGSWNIDDVVVADAACP